MPEETSAVAARADVTPVGSSRVAAEAAGGSGRDLTPMRVHEGRLVLADESGAEFTVAIGQRLQAVLRSAADQAAAAPSPRPALRVETPDSVPEVEGKAETVMESAMRPRDIQNRIRAGESPEHVAEISGSSLQRVLVFAGPILREREHVAESAASASVRRRSPDPVSHVRALGEASRTRLRETGGDPEEIGWDAWRREDGLWTLVGEYAHDREARRATYTFDMQGRFVVPEDDEARWLVGDGRFSGPGRYDEQPLGDDALELVSEDGPRAAATVEPTAVSDDTVDLGEATASVRRRPDLPEPDVARGDADWMAPEVPDSSSRGGAPYEEPMLPWDEPDETAPAARADARPTPPAVDAPADDPGEPSSSSAAEEATDESARPKPKKSSRKPRGRASVPSWDEIMFGNPPED